MYDTEQFMHGIMRMVLVLGVFGAIMMFMLHDINEERNKTVETNTAVLTQLKDKGFLSTSNSNVKVSVKRNYLFSNDISDVTVHVDGNSYTIDSATYFVETVSDKGQGVQVAKHGDREVLELHNIK